jgi:hypothetical protein
LVLSVLFPTRTGPRRVGLLNVCRLRVRLLRWRATITFLRSITARLLASSSTSWKIASDRHSFSSALHHAGRLHRPELCLLVHLALPLGMSLFFAIQ